MTTTTVGTLSKDVEKIVSTLSPEEMAKYISNEINSIATSQAGDADEDARLADVRRIYDEHVITRDMYEYAKFWRAMDTEDIRHWTGAYFRGVLDGLQREDALLTLLIRAESRAWITDYKDLLTTEKRDPVVVERMGIDREHMKGFLARKREIAETVKEIMKADFWQTWKIERPVIDLSENNMAICEKAEAWIAERDLQVAPSGTVKKPRRVRGKATPSSAPSPI